MPIRFRTDPEQRTQTQVVTLDGVKYQLKLYWRRRVRGWYMSLLTLAGVPIIEGQRLSTGAPPLLGYVLPQAPPGQFYVRGVSPYNKLQLGSRLELLYYPEAEVPAVTTVSDDLTITLAS